MRERITIGGRDVRLDLEEIEGMDEAGARAVEAFLASIEAHAARAKAAVLASGDGGARLYYEHHLEECGAEDAGRDFAAFARKLVPVAVWFAAEDGDDWEAMIDYSLGEDVTNYVLCARMDPRGEIAEVVMES